MDNPVLILRLINVLITVGFFPYLYTIYLRTNRKFYLYWGIGFLLYGINILVRVLVPLWFPAFTLELYLSGVFLMSGFISFFSGLGDLIDDVRKLFYLSFVIPVSIILTYVASGPITYGWVLGVSPYLFISICLLYLKIRYNVSVELLIVGWASLLLINIGVPFNLLSAEYVEVLAVFSKLVIFSGVLIPKFSLLADDLKKFLISGGPEVYDSSPVGGLTLINSNMNRKEEIKWILNRVNEEKKMGHRTILITTYDLIAPQEIMNQPISNGELYLIRMVQDNIEGYTLFKDQVSTINDGLNDLSVILSEVIAFSNDRKIQTEIILYSLSTLIHMHDWRSVYVTLVSKMPRLKSTGVRLFCFVHPGAHLDKRVLEVFERIADSSINLTVR